MLRLVVFAITGLPKSHLVSVGSASFKSKRLFAHDNVAVNTITTGIPGRDSHGYAR
jgi:hypothetical protein